jgi:FMNH2-dependent dimethyl sulfone monooxygenase
MDLKAIMRKQADARERELSEMQFGLYGTNGHVTVGSPAIAQAIVAAKGPLSEGRQDLQFEFGLDVMLAAERSGFDIILFAERHLGPDLTTWVIAGAIGSRLETMRSMVAVHPGLWHPTLIAKLATTLDRVCKGGMAINLVTGANEAEFQMFGSTALLNSDDRYVRASEFVKIIEGMWNNDKFSLEGKFYQVRDAELRLKPRNAKAPEMFTAANSPLGRDMIADVGDWWFLPYSRAIRTTDELLRELETGMADMRVRMQRNGRNVRFAFNPFIGFGVDGETALEKTIARIIAHEKNPDTDKIRRSMLPATLGGCMGSPEKIRTQIGRFRDMGIELLLFKMTPDVAEVTRIGEEIIEPYRRTAKAG